MSSCISPSARSITSRGHWVLCFSSSFGRLSLVYSGHDRSAAREMASTTPLSIARKKLPPRRPAAGWLTRSATPSPRSIPACQPRRRWPPAEAGKNGPHRHRSKLNRLERIVKDFLQSPAIRKGSRKSPGPNVSLRSAAVLRAAAGAGGRSFSMMPRKLCFRGDGQSQAGLDQPGQNAAERDRRAGTIHYFEGEAASAFTRRRAAQSVICRRWPTSGPGSQRKGKAIV